jgi:hypothetical protein
MAFHPHLFDPKGPGSGGVGGPTRVYLLFTLLLCGVRLDIVRLVVAATGRPLMPDQSYTIKNPMIRLQ